MKLRCVQHGKRILVISANKAIHRDNGSECHSELQIGSFRGYAKDPMLNRFLNN